MVAWNLTRSEAEYLIDLLEAQQTKQAKWLAEELKELIGMDPKRPEAVD